MDSSCTTIIQSTKCLVSIGLYSKIPRKSIKTAFFMDMLRISYHESTKRAFFMDMSCISYRESIKPASFMDLSYGAYKKGLTNANPFEIIRVSDITARQHPGRLLLPEDLPGHRMDPEHRPEDLPEQPSPYPLKLHAMLPRALSCICQCQRCSEP